ncbi:MAG: Asp-tRNA(Asn)/Glu-tRNA(Gln) amidotransferase subunit GatB [Candidatus Polarisedimenticolia bacterium]
MTDYEPVIGLEVHAQLSTATKIFCGCPTGFGAPPNTNVCPVCLGMPGALPVLNRKVVEYAVKAGLATGCRVHPRSIFERKNYFYPDLPKGYQISQYQQPLATGGSVPIEIEDRAAGQETTRSIGLIRIHMEEDAGKLVHDIPEAAGASGVDFNRSGVPLIEIVSAPDIFSSQEAHAYLARLRAILMALGVCDGNMEEGSLRCDANVSVRPKGTAALGTRVEIKNLNSFRNVSRALEYEIARQSEALSRGEAVVQETRLFDADRGVTEPMRGKEEAMDYRYFPDPDLPPVVVEEAWAESLRAALPELPQARRLRFIEASGMTPREATYFSQNRPLADFYERTARASGDPKAAANWVLGDLMGSLNAAHMGIEQSPVSPESLGALLKLIDEGTISGKIAKTVFEEMFKTGAAPSDIVKARGLEQITDEESIRAVVRAVVEANPAQVVTYRQGRAGTLSWFVGQVMKATGGKASPPVVNRLLRELLEGG